MRDKFGPVWTLTHSGVERARILGNTWMQDDDLLYQTCEDV